MKKETKEIFRADDGSVHETETACLAHEAKIKEQEKNMSYWRITSNPDLTEGRGHCALIYAKVATPKFTSIDPFIQDYCFRKFGRPIAFVQGVAPITNWYCRSLNKEEYLSGGHVSCGDYKYYSKYIELEIGPGETGLQEKQPIKS